MLAISPFLPFVWLQVPIFNLRDIPPIVDTASVHELVGIIAWVVQAEHVVEINRDGVHRIACGCGCVDFVKFAVFIAAIFQVVF